MSYAVAVIAAVFLASGAVSANQKASDILNKPSGYELTPDKGAYKTTPNVGRTTDGLYTPKRYTTDSGNAIQRRINHYKKNWSDPKVRKQARALQKDLQKQIDAMLDALEDSATRQGY